MDYELVKLLMTSNKCECFFHFSTNVSQQQFTTYRTP